MFDGFDAPHSSGGGGADDGFGCLSYVLFVMVVIILVTYFCN